MHPAARENSIPIIMNMLAKDLSLEAPRSPSDRVGGYDILARAIDKCRSDLAGTIGGYHTNCPLDRYLFDWKGTDYTAFRSLVASGAEDDAIAKFVDETGTPKTAEEVVAWNREMEGFRPYENPDMKDWFVGECEPLGLDPKTTPLFKYLDADDKKSFG
jgi:Domain of unknown function (DUF5069)